MIYPFNGHRPNIHKTAFIGDGAIITGDVIIAEYSSVFFHSVIRGDVAQTKIGKRVNIQDHCILHQSPQLPLVVEDGVTVGHQCILHSCRIRKNALIGMGSIIMDDVEIGEGAYIGAGSLVAAGKKIPPHTLAYGRPVKIIRPISEEEKEEMDRIRESYVERGQYYKSLQSI